MRTACMLALWLAHGASDAFAMDPPTPLVPSNGSITSTLMFVPFMFSVLMSHAALSPHGFFQCA